MATTLSTDGPVGSAKVVTWFEVATGETAPTYTLQGTSGLLGSVQMAGTWGGATIVLQGSNDGINWVTLKDPSGTDISLTANGAFEFGTAMLYMRPSPSGGSGDDVDVIVALRG